MLRRAFVFRKGSPGLMSRYDRAYFDRWYRAPRTRVFTRLEIERRVRFVLDAAEHVTEHPVRRVLDVCCGEGHWQPVIKRLRPNASYTGIDVSEYAIERFGRRRNLRRGRFGELGTLGLEGPFDLIVCAGALYYIDTPELAHGLCAIGELLEGVAFLEIFTEDDDLTGNIGDIRHRSAGEYARLMRAARLRHLGLHLWVNQERAKELTEFELGRR